MMYLEMVITIHMGLHRIASRNKHKDELQMTAPQMLKFLENLGFWYPWFWHRSIIYKYTSCQEYRHSAILWLMVRFIKRQICLNILQKVQNLRLVVKKAWKKPNFSPQLAFWQWSTVDYSCATLRLYQVPSNVFYFPNWTPGPDESYH